MEVKLKQRSEKSENGNIQSLEAKVQILKSCVEAHDEDSRILEVKWMQLKIKRSDNKSIFNLTRMSKVLVGDGDLFLT